MGCSHRTAARLLPAAWLLAVTAAAGACGGSEPAAEPASSPTPSSSSISVASTIKSGASLAEPVVWRADVTAGNDAIVDHVDFLIDGRVRWTEHSSPYEFNDGGLFAPWPLGSGSHVLAARAVTADGAKAETSATVDVKTQPGALPTGTYHRSVTDADYVRVRSYRDAAHGAFGEMTPKGPWVMKVSADGVITLDVVPRTEYDATYEPYRSQGHGLTVYGAAPWLQPHPDKPSIFCDPEVSGTYTWSRHGRALTIAGREHVCADRDIVLVGTWQQA